MQRSGCPERMICRAAPPGAARHCALAARLLCALDHAFSVDSPDSSPETVDSRPEVAEPDDRSDPAVVTISGIGTISVEEFDRLIEQARRDRYRADEQAYQRTFLDILLRRASPRASAAATRVRRGPRCRGAGRPAHRRASRSTSRAGPSSDPDEPEPPRRRRHLRLLHNGREPRRGARGFALFQRPRPLERPERGERR